MEHQNLSKEAFTCREASNECGSDTNGDADTNGYTDTNGWVLTKASQYMGIWERRK